MRIILLTLAALGLGACGTSIPDSSSYQTGAAARIDTPPAVSSQPLDATGGAINGQPEDNLAAETQRVLRGNDPITGEPVILASPSNPAPETVETASGISRENDFEAVDAERTIKEDAAFIRNNRAHYEVVKPTALPARSGGAANIVAYALQTRHSVGTKIYNRFSLFGSKSKTASNCAKYASAAKAQQDFLERGGPDRDPKYLDPDGDGFACAWDPASYRAAVSG